METFGSTAGATLISGLPAHVLEGIFAYLACCCLAQCRAVSKTWRAIASADILWRRQLQLEFGVPCGPSASTSPPPPAVRKSSPLDARMTAVAAASDVSAAQATLAGVSAERGEGNGGRSGEREGTPQDTTAAMAAATVAAWSFPGALAYQRVQRHERLAAAQEAATERDVSLAAAGQDGGATAVEALEATCTAHEVFSRLAACPAATHLAYVRRLDAVVQGIIRWRVRVALLAPPTPPQGKDARQGASLAAANAAAAAATAGLPAAAAGTAVKLNGTGGADGDGDNRSGSVALAGALPMVTLRSSTCPCRGVAVNPQSVWLRFRLPGWVRQVAEEQPGWEPGFTCGGSGGGASADGSFMELTVLAEGMDGRCWPAIHSSPFRVPKGDRLRLFQSHVEGLYVWEDEDEGEDDEDAGQSDAEELRDEDEEGDKEHAGGVLSSAGVGGQRRDQDTPRDATDPGVAAHAGAGASGTGGAGARAEGRHSRPGPHLAAYLHYEQLLPVAPREVTTQGGLPLSFQPPHANHPGYPHYVARLEEAARRRRQPPPHPQPQLPHQSPPPPRPPPQEQSPLLQQPLLRPRPEPQPEPEDVTQQDGRQVGQQLQQAQEEQQTQEQEAQNAEGAAPCEAVGSNGWPVMGSPATAVAATATATEAAFAAAETAAAAPSPPSSSESAIKTRLADGPGGASLFTSAAPFCTAAITAATSLELPIGYLYIDWSILPISGSAGGPDVNSGKGGGGWLAGCAVRLWKAVPPLAAELVRPRPDASTAPRQGQVLLYGDSRRGDIVLLSKLPSPWPPGTPMAAAAAEAAAAASQHVTSVSDNAAGDANAASAAVAQHSSMSSSTASTDSMKAEIDSTAARFGAAWQHGFACSSAGHPAVNRWTAAILKELCTGVAPLMADLSLLDGRGRLRLGRCGVEMWTGSDGSSTSMHFLLDQLPPRLQLLWDNKLVVQWGSETSPGAREDGLGSIACGGNGGGAGGGGGDGSGDGAGSDGGLAVDGARGGDGGDLSPWLRMSLQMPLRNYEVLMEEPEVPEVSVLGR